MIKVLFLLSLTLLAVEDAINEPSGLDNFGLQDEVQMQEDEVQIQKDEMQMQDETRNDKMRTQSLKHQQTQINILPPGTNPKRGHGSKISLEFITGDNGI